MTTAAPTRIEIPFADWFIPILLDDQWESCYIPGGRWSGKSYTVADWLLLESFKPGDILCARDFRSSTKESSHKLLSIRIDDHGLADKFHVGENTIRNRETGVEMGFVGLKRMAASVRSRPNLRVLWTEEAHDLDDMDDLNEAITSIRFPNRKLVYTWNPQNEDDPVEIMCRGRKPTDRHAFVTYRDMPFEWLSDEFYADYERLARIQDAAMLRHTFDGAYRPYATISPFGIENIRRARGRKLPLAVGRHGPNTDVVAGVDVARTAHDNSDYTACIKLDSGGNEIASMKFRERNHQVRLSRCADFLLGVLPDSGPPANFVCVDTTEGAGQILCDGLKSHYGIAAYEQPFTTGNKGKMVAYATRRFAENTLSTRNPDLHNELLHFSINEKGASGAEYGHHDDLVAALLLGLECLNRWGLHGSPTSELA